MNETAHFDTAISTVNRLFEGLSKVIRGREDTLKLVITALIADGHVLLEDYPGSGKTTLAKTLGRLIASDTSRGAEPSAAAHILPFRRIQFTPDMLPGDVLGVNVFDAKSGSFHFMHGPVFAHIVLADEINRTGPKVQAAFLECMAEKQVTIDNLTHPLDKLFLVIGTQNPLDIAGTYPLPLVQLDRFLLKIPMAYVDHQTELKILEEHAGIMSLAESIAPVCTRADVLQARAVTQAVFVSPALREAIADIMQATRNDAMLQFGASTRAALMLQASIRGWALVNNRDYATEDDLKFMLPYVLLHRLRFHGSAGDAAEALAALAEPCIEKLVGQALKAPPSSR
jgi:MoxR-like ATPase